MIGGPHDQRLTMILFNASLPARSTAARLLTTACAFGALTLGIAGAQEPKAPAAGQDPVSEAMKQEQPAIDPAVLELRTLIKEGELTNEAARLRYDATIAQNSALIAGLAERYAGEPEKLKAAVKAGSMTAEEALAKREALSNELQGIAFYVEVLQLSMDEARIRAGVESGSISEADGKARFAALQDDRWVAKFIASLELQPKLAKTVQTMLERRAKQGPESSNETAWFGKLLTAKGLTPEQVLRIEAAAVKLAQTEGQPAQSSEDAWMDGVAERLTAAGLSDAQLKVAIQVLPRVMDEAKQEGAEFELDPRIAQHMTEGGLTAKQIQLVAGLTHRLAMTPAIAEAKGAGRGAEEGAGKDGVAELMKRLGLSADAADAIKDELTASGLTAEQVKGSFAGLTRVIPAIQADPEGWTLDPNVKAYFTDELGLNQAQLGKLVKLAQAAAKKG